MNLRWGFVLILLLLIVAISGCTDKDTEQVAVTVSATPAPTILAPVEVFPVQEARTVYVTIKGTMFKPLEYEITNGTTVKWTNDDSSEYIVNVSGFQSPPLSKTKEWSFTFNKTGTYEYRCDLHPSMPHGRITVI